jgi:hypothetical protein
MSVDIPLSNERASEALLVGSFGSSLVSVSDDSGGEHRQKDVRV